jgi:hypothetical protein
MDLNGDMNFLLSAGKLKAKVLALEAHERQYTKEQNQ